jgi:deoxycytidylate deaminase
MVVNRARTELVFALTSAVGTDLGSVDEILTSYLGTDYRYEVVPIKLSDLLGNGTLRLATAIDQSSKFKRYETLMDAGTEARKNFGDDALARVAVSKINMMLDEPTPSAGLESTRSARAYVIHQLKHPSEVNLLRQIYGAGFFLIGVFGAEDVRKKRLCEDLRMSAADAAALMKKDFDEAGMEHGQKSSKTFQRADVFVQSDDDPGPELRRFIDLVFGDPFTTPSRDEYAMYMANAAALRSAELGRQVGAAVFSKQGELIGVGANEVPAPGGGLYWPPKDMPEGVTDGRDFALLKHDSNHHRRNELVDKLLSAAGISAVDPRRAAIDRAVSTITEYGRAVHAELEAILSCARTGVSVRDGTLFTTTFPCHNCVRHVVGSGIRRVVFIEPYPKSLASDLHSDAITLASPGEARRRPEQQRVFLEPFVGVGPRRYQDLFSTSVSSGHEIERKGKDGGNAPGRDDPAWKHTAVPRIPLPATSYLEREVEVVTKGQVKVSDMLKQGGVEQNG